MKLIRILNSMFNRDAVNLKDTIKESLYWLEETRRKCTLGGAWWDKSKNKPEIGGIFLKFQYDCEKLCWVLDNSGVYDIGHTRYSKSKHSYTLRFKGIEWSDNELIKEVTRQYKDFLVYAKKYELEKDFE